VSLTGMWMSATCAATGKRVAPQGTYGPQEFSSLEAQLNRQSTCNKHSVHQADLMQVDKDR
jgi:hypothetical protein